MEFRRALEGLVVTPSFWRGRRVLVTGHTGFKGSWLGLMLSECGAKVSGFALPPEPHPGSLFNLLRLDRVVEGHHLGDVRDARALVTAVEQSKPEVVFHLAAQSLVAPSYADPVTTYATNVMGTLHLLEACRLVGVPVVVVVTSDKCYENRGWPWGYRETDALGGADPYSNSKACTELVVGAYRQSFFKGGEAISRRTRLASARAGNVIGGGDWAEFRLVPDAMRAFTAGKSLELRNPKATRPWQHVLEPLNGYLMLAEGLAQGAAIDDAWNFGPADEDNVAVDVVADQLVDKWGGGASWRLAAGAFPHEAHLLHVDSAKARAGLGWRPVLPLDRALTWTVDWYKSCHNRGDTDGLTRRQIADFLSNPV